MTTKISCNDCDREINRRYKKIILNQNNIYICDTI